MSRAAADDRSGSAAGEAIPMGWRIDGAACWTALVSVGEPVTTVGFIEVAVIVSWVSDHLRSFDGLLWTLRQKPTR
jgi:hypothetical protein